MTEPKEPMEIAKDYEDEIEGLKTQVASLREELVKSQRYDYECVHVKQDVLGGDCVHCANAVAEKGLEKCKEQNAKLREGLRKLFNLYVLGEGNCHQIKSEIEKLLSPKDGEEGGL